MAAAVTIAVLKKSGDHIQEVLAEEIVAEPMNALAQQPPLVAQGPTVK